MVDNVRSTLFMFVPQIGPTQDDLKRRTQGQRPPVVSGSFARISGFARRTSRRRDVIGFRFSLFNLLPYGIGLVGRGATPQMADAQGGRGGVGIRVLFPCVAAVPPVMQVPVKVFLSGYGLVKPSVRVCRKATIWFSSLSVKPSIPVVLSTVAVT